MAKARIYQSDAISETKQAIWGGHKHILIWIATGGGKGFIMSEMTRTTLLKSNKVLTIMRGRSIVLQTADNYQKYFNIESSILMGNDKRFNPESDCQIASIDTLTRRDLDFIKDVDLIIIDEAHLCTSDSYQKIFEIFKDKIIIGFTATPYMIGNKTHDNWTKVVKPIEAHELRDQGYLVPVRAYCPKAIDTSGLKKISGDFQLNDLFDRVNTPAVIGDIVETYQEYGQNKQALLYAVNVKHSKMMCEAFNQVGIKAAHIDAENDSQSRRDILDKFKRKEIQIICSVGTMTTGIDLPIAEVGIMARPTMSETLDYQMRGRLLRPYKLCTCGREFGFENVCHEIAYEKQYAMILDHGNNIDRNGLTYQVKEAAMKGYEKPKKEKPKPDAPLSIRQCPTCFMYIESNQNECPTCKFDFPVNAKQFKTEAGKLYFMDEQELEQKRGKKIKARFKYYTNVGRIKKLWPTFKFQQLYKEFGTESFKYVKFPDNLIKKYKKENLRKH